MADNDWRSNLKDLFEGIEIIKKSQRETLLRFNSFREMVAEPAFELLAEELKEYRVKSYLTKSRGNTIHFWISFPRSGKDSFHYTIYFPKNSVELNLKLRLKGRKDSRSPYVEKEAEFMDSLSPTEVSKVKPVDLVQDFITHCRNFSYELLTQTE